MWLLDYGGILILAAIYLTLAMGKVPPTTFIIHVSFSHDNIPVKSGLLFSPLYRWENRSLRVMSSYYER